MKKLPAILGGVGAAWLVYRILARLIGGADGTLQGPDNLAVFGAITCAVSWWLWHRAESVQKAVADAARVLAIGGLLLIPALFVFFHREPALLKASGLAQPEIDAHMTTLSARDVDLQLGLLTATVFGIVFLLTRTRKSTTQAGPRAPRTETAKLLILGQLLAWGSSGASAYWLEMGDLDIWEGLCVMLLIVVALACLIPLSIAGIIQGIRLVRASSGRWIGIASIVVSILPATYTVLMMLEAVQVNGGTPVPQPNLVLRDRYAKYSAFFTAPQPLASAYADSTGNVVLVFADSVEVTVLSNEGESLASFCRERLVGQPIDVSVPTEKRFYGSVGAVDSEHGWKVSHRQNTISEFRIRTVAIDRERADDSGRESVWRTADLLSGNFLITYGVDSRGRCKIGREPKQCSIANPTPTDTEAWREAQYVRRQETFDKLLPLADADQSGKVSSREGEPFEAAVEAGLKVAYLEDHGIARRDEFARAVGRRNVDNYLLFREKLSSAGFGEASSVMIPEP